MLSPEIWNECLRLFEKFKINQHISFNSKFLSLVYKDDYLYIEYSGYDTVGELYEDIIEIPLDQFLLYSELEMKQVQ